MEQLLMYWRPCEIAPLDLPSGYRLVRFRRGGVPELSLDTFRRGYLKTIAPNREPDAWEFPWFYDDKRIPDDGFFVVVQKDCGEVIATASVQLGEHTPDSATLHMVACHPEHRGKRLGELLTVEAMRYVYVHGIRGMYLTTDDERLPAVKIYLRCGFRPVLFCEGMRERWCTLLSRLGVKETAAYDGEGKPSLRLP